MSLMAFLLAAALSAASMPVIIEFARRRRLFDKHDERKVHDGEVPRLGGVGISFAFICSVGAFVALEYSFRSSVAHGIRVLPLVLSGVAILMLGLIDDLRTLRARFKLVIQAAATLLVMSAGYRFKIVLIPWGNGTFDLGVFSWPLTFIWIIGVTNAINLIDGMDGLAAGISAIAATAFGTMMLIGGDTMGAVLCFALCGAAVGFLLYNKPPAKIFMGDSGSLFLGFCLSVLPLLGQTDHDARIGFLSASTILAIPIFDTLSAIWRRTRAGISFFTPDRGHMHHRLQTLGFGPKAVLAVVYSACIILSLSAVSSVLLPSPWSFSVKVAALAACLCGFIALNGVKIINPENGNGTDTHNPPTTRN